MTIAKKMKKMKEVLKGAALVGLGTAVSAGASALANDVAKTNLVDAKKESIDEKDNFYHMTLQKNGVKNVDQKETFYHMTLLKNGEQQQLAPQDNFYHMTLQKNNLVKPESNIIEQKSNLKQVPIKKAPAQD